MARKIHPSMKPDMVVSEMMSSNPVVIGESTSLLEAAKKMHESQAGCLLIETAGQTLGIVTERDMLKALGNDLAPDSPVSRIMSASLITVDSRLNIHDAYHQLLAHEIHHLVAVDESGRPVGILTESDFRKYKGLENFITFLDVASAMSHHYVEAQPSDPVVKVAATAQQNRSDCVVIVQNGMPVGLLTLRDMVRLYRLQMQHVETGEVINRSIETVSPQNLLIDSAKLMWEKDLRCLVVVDESGKMVGLLNEHDIIRHMEDEYILLLKDLIRDQARQLNDDQFRSVINQISHRVLVKDLDSVYVSCNESYARDIGIRPEQIAGRTDFDFFPRELAERYRADDLRVLESGERMEIEEPYTIEGRTRWVSTSKSPMRSASGEITGVVVVLSDVTEKKEAEESAARHNWALKALSESNAALVYATTEQELIRGVCRAITSDDAYQLAWIGSRDPDHGVSVIAAEGSAKEYADGLRISWGEDELGQGPTGTAIRTEKLIIQNRLDGSDDFHPWQSRAKSYNLHSSVALPVRIGGEVSASLTVYSHHPNAFTESAIKLFQEIAINLAYGIESRRTKLAYEKAMLEQVRQARKLEKSLEDSLMAIAATLEQRDPYTAGHEKNVADLAVRIGRKLGWDEHRLQGLYLAGVVHDLGKIQIPVEILTKPGRLTPAEYTLIKIHPETGYNILKNIEYPWPIAEIVRQHHEYLDGSGYPQGLGREQILDEAKVLTVADIYESMSSARPYRAALGKDSAIGEIRRLRGVKLDPSVVDAFLEIV